MSVSYQDGDNFIRNAVTVLGSTQRGPEARLVTVSTGGLPVPIEELLADIRVDDPEDDEATVERFARAACAFIERRTGWVLLPTQYLVTASRWWTGPMEIPRGPFRSFEGLEYLRDRNDVVVVDPDLIWATGVGRETKVRLLPDFSSPTLWQAEDCVTLRFSAGFDAADESGGLGLEIEDGLRTILMMVTAHYYANRELLGLADARVGLGAVELGATSLLGQYRQFW